MQLSEMQKTFRRNSEWAHNKLDMRRLKRRQARLKIARQELPG
jgi:hypothetical protein